MCRCAVHLVNCYFCKCNCSIIWLRFVEQFIITVISINSFWCIKYILIQEMLDTSQLFGRSDQWTLDPSQMRCGDQCFQTICSAANSMYQIVYKSCNPEFHSKLMIACHYLAAQLVIDNITNNQFLEIVSGCISFRELAVLSKRVFMLCGFDLLRFL